MSDVKSTVRSAQSNNRFLDYLLSTSLDPTLHRPCQRLMTCQRTDALGSVFKRLSTEGFLSCPVLDGNRYMGFISCFDIVNYVTTMFWGSEGEEWTRFFDNSAEFKAATVDAVMETPLWRGQQTAEPLYTSNTTLHALEKLAVCRAHRAAVLDPISLRVVNIMSQSMLISEIRQRMNMLGSLRTKTVAEMTSWWQLVHTICEDEKAINAFLRMRTSNVHGLAVVDSEGVLTGSISVRDLRGIGADGPFFSRLFLPISDFKATLRREFPTLGPRGHYYIGRTPLNARYVTPQSTFEDVINMMDDGCIHRVYVCSSDSVRQGAPIPENVISQTNVLSAVLQHFCVPAPARLLAGRG